MKTRFDVTLKQIENNTKWEKTGSHSKNIFFLVPFSEVKKDMVKLEIPRLRRSEVNLIKERMEKDLPVKEIENNRFTGINEVQLLVCLYEGHLLLQKGYNYCKAAEEMLKHGKDVRVKVILVTKGFGFKTFMSEFRSSNGYK